MTTSGARTALGRSHVFWGRQLAPSRLPQSSRGRYNLATRSFTSITRRLATQDYGSGAGDPKGEDPIAQGHNPKVDAEHPGPEPPDVGTGSNSAKRAQPKIHSKQHPEEESEAVRKHNEDLKNTKGTSHSAHQGEPVEKGFWRGEGDA